MEIWRLGSAILQNKFLVRNEVLTEIGSGSVDFLQLHHSHRFLVVFASVVSSGSALFLTVRVHVVCMFLCAHYSSRGVPASPRPAVLLSLPNMRERSVIKSRLRSAAVRLPHRRPEHASAELRTLRRILQIAAGCYFIIWAHVIWQLSFFAPREPFLIVSDFGWNRRDKFFASVSPCISACIPMYIMRCACNTV